MMYMIIISGCCLTSLLRLLTALMYSFIIFDGPHAILSHSISTDFIQPLIFLVVLVDLAVKLVLEVFVFVVLLIVLVVVVVLVVLQVLVVLIVLIVLIVFLVLVNLC